jgi:3-keto-disaccharide hydrolase
MSIPEGKTGGEDTQTPQPKRGLRAILITSLIIVLLILSVGGFLFLQAGKGKDAELPTGTATPTPTPTPPVMYLETPPPQAVFYDTFINNALSWGISNSVGYIRTLENHKLTLTDTNPNTTLIESLPTNTMFDNFTVSVDLTIVNAGRNDSAGIYIRGDNNMDHDYRIDINADNTFDIAKEYLDPNNNPQTTFLDGPRRGPVLNPLGVQNTITVIMVGPQLLLFINNMKVSTITDSDYTTGQIALFAHTSENSNGVTVSFGRVEVDNPPDKLPV